MKILKNKKGMAYILTCVIVLIGMMMISVLLQYVSVRSTIISQKDAVQVKLDSVVVKSAMENYDALRQGSLYQDHLDYLKLEQDAYAALGFFDPDIETVRENLYTMNRPQIIRITEDGFGLTVKYELEVPFVVMGIHYGEITVPITLISKFTEK